MIPFVKMHGIGNDYVYINGFEHAVSDPVGLAKRIADRHFGVGGDGLILVLPPEKGVQADVRMRMFNADGSESEMCGNGIRCVCKLAHDDGLSRANPMRIQTGRGVLTLSYHANGNGTVSSVTVDMGEPIINAGDIPVALPRSSPSNQIIDFPLWKYIPGGEQGAAWMEDCQLDQRMTCVSMGNPHMVVYCGSVAAFPLETLGPFFERQNIFSSRINVHAVQVHSRKEVTMRTWERGSGITLGCGTGASAVCAAGVLTNRTDREILAHLPGGDLNLRWDEKTNHVFKTGPATEVFRGVWPG